MDALLIIDVQNDYCPGGALPVPEADLAIPVINRLRSAFDVIIHARDWRPANHCSFAGSHPGREPGDVIRIGSDELVLQPAHCVQGSPGADPPDALVVGPEDLLIQKGVNPAVPSHSAFYDADRSRSTGLETLLYREGASDVCICGLGLEGSILRTALDARWIGFDVAVVLDACRGCDPSAQKAALDQIRESGGRTITSADLLGGP